MVKQLLHTLLAACLLTGCAVQPYEAVNRPNASPWLPCPSTPNCVNSLHRASIEPLRYQGEKVITRQRLIEIISRLPRHQWVKQEPDYLQVTIRSAVFGFIDDLEFAFTDTEIHVRSAARSGYYDFGVNRRRVEWVRKALAEAELGRQATSFSKHLSHTKDKLALLPKSIRKKSKVVRDDF